MTGIEYDHDMDEMTVHSPKVQLMSISSALKASINLISKIANLATPNSLYHVEWILQNINHILETSKHITTSKI